MIKKALLALTLVAAAAAPAFANTDAAFGNPNPTDDQLAFTKTAILEELHQKGINATDVEDWGNLIRADVTLADGTSHVQLFQPGSLQPVSANQIN